MTTDVHRGNDDGTARPNGAAATIALEPAAPATRVRLFAELTLLYVGLPTLYLLGFVPLAKIPFLLLVVTGVCVALAFDPSFDRRLLWNAAPLRGEWRRIVLTFAIGAAGLAVFTALLFPERLFDLPRTEPVTWLVLMFAYPLLSVFPQEVVYRTFFYHRYAPILPEQVLRIGLNAAAFGYMHIVYENWIAVVLTTIGGVLLARTYERTRSTLTASFEHALYGCLVFTIGLGEFFS